LWIGRLRSFLMGSRRCFVPAWSNLSANQVGKGEERYGPRLNNLRLIGSVCERDCNLVRGACKVERSLDAKAVRVLQAEGDE
jgi:hypothetical protein